MTKTYVLISPLKLLSVRFMKLYWFYIYRFFNFIMSVDLIRIYYKMLYYIIDCILIEVVEDLLNNLYV